MKDRAEPRVFVGGPMHGKWALVPQGSSVSVPVLEGDVLAHYGGAFVRHDGAVTASSSRFGSIEYQAYEIARSDEVRTVLMQPGWISMPRTCAENDEAWAMADPNCSEAVRLMRVEADRMSKEAYQDALKAACLACFKEQRDMSYGYVYFCEESSCTEVTVGWVGDHTCEAGVTFAELQRLSELLGTKDINFAGRTECGYYDEVEGRVELVCRVKSLPSLEQLESTPTESLA